MPTNKKFTDFASGGDTQVGDVHVGYRAGVYTQYDVPGAGFKDANGNYLVKWVSGGAAAVNYPELVSALTLTGAEVRAEGTDTNIDLKLTPKGTGQLNLDGVKFPNVAGTAGQGFVLSSPTTMAYANLPVVTSGTTTDNAVARYDGTSGDLQNSSILINDTDEISGITNLTVDNININGNSLISTDLNGDINFTPNGTGSVIIDGLSHPQADGSTNTFMYTDGAAQIGFSTAAYPLTATGTGTVLRADGTDWAASTATFANTYGASELLYSNGANTVEGLTTANSAALVTTSAGVPAYTASLTDGQLIIGDTGGTPVAASLTAGSNVTITPGAGTITIAATGATGLVWNTVAGTTQSAAVNNAYRTDNASATTVTLPGTAALGDVVAVEGSGAGGWILAANTGQTILIGSSSTTTAGDLTSAASTDNVYVTCIVANTTWRVRTTNSSGLTIG